MTDFIVEQIRASRDLKAAMLADEQLIDSIRAVAECVVESHRAGGKVLLAGNGGSAADAQHIAAELVGRYVIDRKALPAIALTTDTSVLTALGNDFGYESVFARQIEALGGPDDVFIGISTSGRSTNILSALDAARLGHLVTVVLTGEDGAVLSGRCDHLLVVPSRETSRVQEAHILIGHIICSVVEAKAC